MLNGYGVNGAYTPAWVVRAAVVAVVAAATVTAASTRIVPATAYGDANVVVSLTQIRTVAAFATAAGDVSSSVASALIYAGRANALAQATSTALVYRSVPAQAAGDASANGTALANAKLGEATATAESTVVLCQAHRIRPGASYRLAELTQTPAGADVTRYSPAIAQAAATGRAEASTKLNGQSYFRHDGYVLGASSVCLALVEQDKIKIIATLGSFDFANGTGLGTPFVRHPGASYSLGASNAVSIVGQRNARAIVAATAAADSAAVAIKTQPGAALATAAATKVSIAVAQRHAASASNSADTASFPVVGKRTAHGASIATAEATAFAVVFGQQFFEIVGTTAGVVSQVQPTLFYLAQALGSPVALANAPTPGSQFPSLAFAQSGAYALPVSVKFFVVVLQNATATGTAGALTLSDKPAPQERQMIVSGDDRAMIVTFENRIMVVPS